MKNLLSFVFLITIASSLAYSQVSDAALKAIVEKDRASRSADGKLVTLTAAEHLERGRAYFDNRQFPQSREHFQKIFDNFSSDPAMSGALFMTGRSYYWERQYARAIPFLDRISREYPALKDGREGLYFKGACLVRLGKNAEAAKIYEQYVTMYPMGERIDGAYLNAIDSLRESNQYDAANQWVDRVRDKFAGQPTETNALHARLRMHIYRGLWADAEATAALTQAQAKFAGSMTSLDEIKYLRAFALEKAGKKNDAMAMYASIPDNGRSYFGGLAAEKVAGSTGRVKTIAQVTPTDFPAPYRMEILQYAKKHKIDPRFVLAIMKQESSFRPAVKSPSAARGLMQLVLDTALKYNKKAGYTALQPDDLYQPRINIAIGIEYLADLKGQFGGLYEAIAASYNGGEDNAMRWLNRSKPKDPAIFASEVGFAETKTYVFKVMTNLRIYRDLYDDNLMKR
ncbi:MAG: transglycosylase SLT domain-containing protein [Acidobacteria bacterium]|nr:transglycosylase SLT domain-containing protein [Acidobacteriota bacterium]